MDGQKTKWVSNTVLHVSYTADLIHIVHSAPYSSNLLLRSVINTEEDKEIWVYDGLLLH